MPEDNESTEVEVEISEPAIEEDIDSELILLGLNAAFISTDTRARDRVMRYYPDLITENLSSLPLRIQISLVEENLKANPHAFTESFWVNYLKSTIKKMKCYRDNYEENKLYYLANLAYDFITCGGVDWFEVLEDFSSGVVASGESPLFTTILDLLIMSDSTSLRKLLYKTETKKYPTSLRLKLYSRLISLGLLDVKMARRIRSDSSGNISLSAIRQLFINRNLYSDEDFESLATQFCDTKHKYASRFIAFNMPIGLMLFLLGSDDPVTVSIVSKRMSAEG